MKTMPIDHWHKVMCKLAHTFPGILHGDRKAPISAHGLIGFLEKELRVDEQLMTIAENALPKPKEPH